jgi:hypothetical protein
MKRIEIAIRGIDEKQSVGIKIPGDIQTEIFLGHDIEERGIAISVQKEIDIAGDGSLGDAVGIDVSEDIIENLDCRIFIYQYSPDIEDRQVEAAAYGGKRVFRLEVDFEIVIAIYRYSPDSETVTAWDAIEVVCQIDLKRIADCGGFSQGGKVIFKG